MQEKRHFKLSVHGKAGKNAKFLQLFDLIDKQDKYDEEELTQVLYPDGSYKQSTFSELKKYLYLTILRSLHSFDEENSYEIKIKLKIIDIQVLYSRGLLDLAFSMAKKLVKNLNTNVLKPSTVQETHNLLYLIVISSKNISHINYILNLDYHSYNLIEKFSNALFTSLEFIKIYQTKGISNKFEELNLKLLEYQIQFEETYENIWLQRIIYIIEADYRVISGDLNEKIYSTQKLLDSTIKLSEYNKLPQLELLREVQALISSYLLCGRYIDALEKILFLKTEILSNNIPTKIFPSVVSFYISSTLSYCVLTGEFILGKSAIQNFSTFRDKIIDRILPSILIQKFNINFGCKDFKEAQSSLDSLISSEYPISEDLFKAQKFCMIIIHNVLQNDELNEALIKNTRKFLNRKKDLNSFDKIFLKFFMNLSLNHNKKKASDLFKPFLEYLESMQDQIWFNNYFHFTSWVKSQCLGNGYNEQVKEKLPNSVKDELLKYRDIDFSISL